jgi:hypothetical protein
MSYRTRKYNRMIKKLSELEFTELATEHGSVLKSSIEIDRSEADFLIKVLKRQRDLTKNQSSIET